MLLEPGEITVIFNGHNFVKEHNRESPTAPDARAHGGSFLKGQAHSHAFPQLPPTTPEHRPRPEDNSSWFYQVSGEDLASPPPSRLPVGTCQSLVTNITEKQPSESSTRRKDPPGGHPTPPRPTPWPPTAGGAQETSTWLPRSRRETGGTPPALLHAAPPCPGAARAFLPECCPHTRKMVLVRSAPGPSEHAGAPVRDRPVSEDPRGPRETPHVHLRLTEELMECTGCRLGDARPFLGFAGV